MLAWLPLSEKKSLFGSIFRFSRRFLIKDLHLAKLMVGDDDQSNLAERRDCGANCLLRNNFIQKRQLG
jgi:hypothetical protein